ncbi:MAG: tetratricopeptide repeat protein [Planctomycetota bacterium]
MRILSGFSLSLLAAAACSEEPLSQASAPESPGSPVLALRTPRNGDARVDLLRKHIEFGRLDEARALSEELGMIGENGSEALLLRARLAALEGQNIAAFRLVETARQESPADPDVYATCAEIYAAADKLDAAWDEIQAGDRACGSAPELLRARGIVWISRQGGAQKGLSYLEDAKRADPGLPFVSRALGQAHLLLGKQGAAAGKADEALAHARQAISYDPDDVDVARFLTEALALAGDFDGAITATSNLMARGLPLQAELALLHKKAGMAALLRRERPSAIEHFATARKLGLSDVELATGAMILEEQADALVKRGVEAYESNDLAESEASFLRALEIDADRIEARNHLGVVLFKSGDYAGAADCWEIVCRTAEREGIVLPEPVHVNLAKARELAGDIPGARAALEVYLVHDPDGEWAESTRAALAALPARNPGN